MHQGNPGLLLSPHYSVQSDLPRPGAEAESTPLFAPRIYLVDPDPLTLVLLMKYLRDKGFDVVAATDMEASPPPVDMLIVVLDGMEPRANRPGWLLEKPGMPTIVLDRSHVFPGRAAPVGFTPDARLSLPTQPRKLVATIRQVLSLARIESVDPCEAAVRIYRFSGWTLYPYERRLESRHGTSVLLEKRDCEVLRALLTFPHQVLTRQQLIDLVFGSGKKIKNGTLDRFITHLRRHLGDDVKFPTLIKTVVGTGYRFDAYVEKSLYPSSQTPSV
jgi:DNA-binding response OmpR family regulator